MATQASGVNNERRRGASDDLPTPKLGKGPATRSGFGNECLGNGVYAWMSNAWNEGHMHRTLVQEDQWYLAS